LVGEGHDAASGLKEGECSPEPRHLLPRQNLGPASEVLRSVQDRVVGGAQVQWERGARGLDERTAPLLGGSLALRATLEEVTHDLLGPVHAQTAAQSCLDLLRRIVLAHPRPPVTRSSQHYTEKGRLRDRQRYHRPAGRERVRRAHAPRMSEEESK